MYCFIIVPAVTISGVDAPGYPTVNNQGKLYSTILTFLIPSMIFQPHIL